MSVKELQEITQHLIAAGSAKGADGRDVFLYIRDDSVLISKEWNGVETILAESVRPHSTVSYVLTENIEVIAYVDTSSKLRAIRFDDSCGEWDDVPVSIDVHYEGNVAACLGQNGRIMVVHQNNHSQLVMLDLENPHNTTVIQVNSSSKSPLWASFIKSTLFVFYISYHDQCLHVYDTNTQKDKKWTVLPFNGTTKRFIVKSNTRAKHLEFEAYVLTSEEELCHIKADGQWEKLGRVDITNRTFISERAVDICCIEAQNNTLSEEHLGQLLRADPSVIDAIGGPLSVTPLATACWSGSLDAVCLLLDNPYCLANPNQLSPRKRTPLYFAICCSQAHRKEIVAALLDAGANVDECYEEDELNTPLMNTVLDKGNKEVIHALVDRGASLTKRNMQGQTAVMLAEGSGMEKELLPWKERQKQTTKPHSVQNEVIDVLAAIAMLIIAYFNNDIIKNFVNSILTKLHGQNLINEEESPDGDGEGNLTSGAHKRPE
jgi:hypothetical protein